jgi:hypothetical protein
MVQEVLVVVGEVVAAVGLRDVVEVVTFAGCAAASSDFSPGLQIGVGGSPCRTRVL